MALGDGGNDAFTMGPHSFPFPSNPRGSLVVGVNRFVGGWGKFKTSNLISAAFGSGARSRSRFTNP